MEDLETVHEGPTLLLVPSGTGDRLAKQGRGSGARGPGRVTGGAFYNPAMRFNRELSILFIQMRMLERAAARKGRDPARFRFFDALAATGARTVRVAAEAKVPEGVRFEAVACDRDPRVFSLLTRNIAMNRVADKVAALRGDMHEIAARSRFDHVDIDPFGSPAPFLDSAVRCVGRGGSLALTATDTAALTGSSPAACLRRYQARPWPGAGRHEAALRILTGAAVRAGARHEVALRPLLAHATDHYVRVYLEAMKGARRSDAALEGIGYMVQGADGTVYPVEDAGAVPRDARAWAGPMWIEKIQDRRLVASLQERLEDHPEMDLRPLQKFLLLAAEESTGPPLYYELGELARAAKAGPPTMSDLLKRIWDRGFRASRSHASPTGVKTDLRWPELIELMSGPNRFS